LGELAMEQRLDFVEHHPVGPVGEARSLEKLTAFIQG